uniref:Uncharacterized protein n=1 Tax=Anguilla anguilla TaxID=7936 RepID=A0A0E9RKR4_ANGAN
MSSYQRSVSIMTVHSLLCNECSISSADKGCRGINSYWK